MDDIIEQVADLGPGKKVCLKDKHDYECVGVVVTVNDEILVLDEVVQCHTNKKELGKQDFSIVDLVSVRIIGKDLSAEKCQNEDNIEVDLELEGFQQEKRIVPWFFKRNRRDNPHLHRLTQLEIHNALLPQETLNSNGLSGSDWVIEEVKPGTDNKLTMPSFVIPSPSRHTRHSEEPERSGKTIAFVSVVREVFWASNNTLPILNNLPTRAFLVATKENLDLALKGIEKCAAVGVSCAGRHVGRFGSVSLLAVSTRDSVFLIDVSVLRNLLKPFLDRVFACEHLLKVIHDARQLSDWLYHRFNVNLVNVQDTLAAHNYFLVLSGLFETGAVPMYATSVSALSKAYFGIADKDLFFPRVRSDGLEDAEVWFERPLRPRLMLGVIQNVMFLLDLREAINQCIMKPSEMATQALVRDVKEADDGTAERVLEQPHRLPPTMQAALRMPFVSNSNRGSYGIVDCNRGFVHNSVGHVDPVVVFSRDVMHSAQK